MSARVLLLALMATCHMGCDAAMPDGTAHGADGGDPGPGGSVTGACKRHVMTSTVAENGERQETTTYAYYVEGLAPGSDLTAILCDPVELPTIPADPSACPSTFSSCVPSGDPRPTLTGRTCQVRGIEGLYIGSVLQILCGQDTVRRNAGGTVLSQRGSHFTTVEIRR